MIRCQRADGARILKCEYRLAKRIENLTCFMESE